MSQIPEYIRHAAHPLCGSPEDFDPLLERCANARVVLLGEATHGTHEFYQARAEITRRLITEQGFHALALEADWPDAWRVGQFVKGVNGDGAATEALAGFKRFPQWMWRNSDMLDFVGWLRSHNDESITPEGKVGIYGLDLYSLNDSITAVLEYLKKVDPAAAQHFSRRYACFEHFGGNTQRYGLFTGTGISKSCEEEVVSATDEAVAAQSLSVPAQPVAAAAGSSAAGPAARSAAGSNEGLPKHFRRGETTFNRRFFETQFPSLFKVVASEADKDLVLDISTAAGVIVATRISRISGNDLALKSSDGTERTVEFTQVLEVKLRNKNT